MGKLSDIYEKAGLFYLGKDVDKNTQEPTDILTLLKNKNFTTHAAIIGMTGSGKTGLGIDLLEEAAIDNIPAIIIDPKGDMGNLLLTDANFDPQTFLPWVKEEAKAKGIDPLEYAKEVANTWKKGIEKFGQDSQRVAKFSKVQKTIYTPGSSAGVAINIASSLELPSKAILEDSDDFATYLSATTASLLALIGEEGLLESKEYIYLAQIIKYFWQKHQSLNIEKLVGAILEPPFKKIGVLSLESFITQKERFSLANKFNALIASPNFFSWLQGESLEIDKLLYDKEGKAKLSIFTISHLNDKERMFFVTLLLNKLIAWMRMQSGSSHLRALLYMDEIFGFFPPTKNPPSKEPMLLLLKQARAYGLGVVLSTQNPVDLDYKGLSNIGTWFIGRLQTKQDIAKVIDGLSGKLGSTLTKTQIQSLLANLNKRIFFLKSAHEENIRLFTTRWAMSYLKGPLNKDEISTLMQSQKVQSKDISTSLQSQDEFVDNIIVNGNVIQRYEVNLSPQKRYFPTIASSVTLHFIDNRRSIDYKLTKELYINLLEAKSCNWQESEILENKLESFSTKKPQNAKFKPLPPFISEDKDLKNCQKELKEYLYLYEKLPLFKCKKLKMESKVNETKEEFLIKVKDRLKELQEEAINELKTKYQKRIERINMQLQKANERLEKEKADQTSSLISAGLSLLSAFFGRSSFSKVATAASRSSRVLKEHQDLKQAKERIQALEEKLQELEDELTLKIEELYDKYDIKNFPIEEIFIKPKKSNIDINEIAIVWRAMV